jgi:hypothetical protein
MEVMIMAELRLETETINAIVESIRKIANGDGEKCFERLADNFIYDLYPWSAGKAMELAEGLLLRCFKNDVKAMIFDLHQYLEKAKIETCAAEDLPLINAVWEKALVYLDRTDGWPTLDNAIFLQCAFYVWYHIDIAKKSSAYSLVRKAIFQKTLTDTDNFIESLEEANDYRPPLYAAMLERCNPADIWLLTKDAHLGRFKSLKDWAKAVEIRAQILALNEIMRNSRTAITGARQFRHDLVAELTECFSEPLMELEKWLAEPAFSQLPQIVGDYG